MVTNFLSSGIEGVERFKMAPNTRRRAERYSNRKQQIGGAAKI